MALITSSEVFKSPRFALLTFAEASGRWPKKYREFDPAFLRMLHPGSFVKVMATSVSERPVREEVWLVITKLSPVRGKGKHIGEVRTHTGRSEYHGLVLGMRIHFQFVNVLDMQFNIVQNS